MEEEKKEDRGFTVRDRRGSYDETEEPEEPRGEEKAEEPERAPKEEAEGQPGEEPGARPPLPEVNFATFAISLATAAFHQMGLVGEEEGEKPPRDLELAKHTIDTLAMLEEKTRGNLNPEEENLLTGLLAELRLRYVKLLG